MNEAIPSDFMLMIERFESREQVDARRDRAKRLRTHPSAIDAWGRLWKSAILEGVPSMCDFLLLDCMTRFFDDTSLQTSMEKTEGCNDAAKLAKRLAGLIESNGSLKNICVDECDPSLTLRTHGVVLYPDGKIYDAHGVRLADVLKRFASIASNRADWPASHSKPKEKNAERNSLIVILCLHCYNFLGRPCYKEVGLLIQAIYNNELTTQQVRDVWKRSSCAC